MSWRAVAAEVLSEPEAERARLVTAPSVAEPPELVARLKALGAQSPPTGLSPMQWAGALLRVERFIKRWGAAALALGWTADDLLAVDLQAWMRLDRRGALFLMVDAEVVGVTADEIAVRKGRALFRLRRRWST